MCSYPISDFRNLSLLLNKQFSRSKPVWQLKYNWFILNNWVQAFKLVIISLLIKMNFTDVFSTLLGMCSKTPFFSNVRAVAGWPHWDAICKSVLPSCTGSSGRDTLETSSQITTHGHNEKKKQKKKTYEISSVAFILDSNDIHLKTNGNICWKSPGKQTPVISRMHVSSRVSQQRLKLCTKKVCKSASQRSQYFLYQMIWAAPHSFYTSIRLV